MSESDLIADTEVGRISGVGACSPAPSLEMAIRRVADLTHRLNHAIVAAVDSGATVELMRCSRHHDGDGRWGDQMQPVVRIRDDR